MHFQTIYLQEKDRSLCIITKDLCWSDMTEMNSYIQNIPFKILMFSFLVRSKFQ